MLSSLSLSLSILPVCRVFRYFLLGSLIAGGGLYLNDRTLNKLLFKGINQAVFLLPAPLQPIWDATMITFTHLGDTHIMLWLITLIGLFVWVTQKKHIEPYSFTEKLLPLAVLWLVLIIGSVITHGLKNIIGEARPAGVLPIDTIHILGEPLMKRAFPSGHTVTAFAGLSALWPLLSSTPRKIALFLAIGIGISRIGVGAHWPTDVVVGAVIGFGVGLGCWAICLKLITPPLVFAQNTVSKTVITLAVLGGLSLLANIVYTPFYDLEYRGLRLAMIAFLLGALAIVAIIFRYRRTS